MKKIYKIALVGAGILAYLALKRKTIQYEGLLPDSEENGKNNALPITPNLGDWKIDKLFQEKEGNLYVDSKKA